MHDKYQMAYICFANIHELKNTCFQGDIGMKC